MFGRDKKENSPRFFTPKFNEQARVLFNGTLIGIGGRWATWPCEYAMYQSSEKSNTKSLWKIYTDMASWKKLHLLNKSFLKTGFIQTLGKSASNIGVLHHIGHYHPDLAPTSKGLFAAGLSAPFETILTSRGEYRKVRSFYQAGLRADQINSLFPPGFSRILAVSFMRNFSTSVITFTGIYKMTEMLKPQFPASLSDSPIRKGISASLANVIAQPFNMPFINFQTYVLRDSIKQPTISAAVKSFYKEHTVREMFKGASARIIHRSIFYGLTFMASTYLEQKEQIKHPYALENRMTKPNLK